MAAREYQRLTIQIKVIEGVELVSTEKKHQIWGFYSLLVVMQPYLVRLNVARSGWLISDSGSSCCLFGCWLLACCPKHLARQGVNLDLHKEPRPTFQRWGLPASEER